jgi:hypothetical protein
MYINSCFVSILYKNLYIETRGLISSRGKVVVYLRTGGIPDEKIILDDAHLLKGQNINRVK